MDLSRGYSPWKGGAGDNTANLFGGADIDYHVSQGRSGQEMLNFINANPDKIKSSVARSRIEAMARNERNASAARSASSSSNSSGNRSSGSSPSAGAYNPALVNFSPEGIDLGDAAGWSNEDFIRSLAKDRAQRWEEAKKDGEANEFNNISNNVEQNIGNKGDWYSNVSDIEGDIINSAIGNDYSLNLGSLNVANRIR